MKSKREIKIAWIINGRPPFAWSYFMQIHIFAKYLNNYGYHSIIINTESVETDSSDMLAAIKKSRCKILINIGDVHIKNLAKVTGLPVISLVTNGTGITNLKGITENTIFACTTRFAQRLLRKAKVRPTPYLPHGFDPNIFHPASQKSARKKLGWSHKEPTILMLGTNYPVNPNDATNAPNVDRKNWVGGLKAFADFHVIRPEVKLFTHTNSYGAVEIPYWVDKLNLAGSVILADDKSRTGQTINTQINNKPQTYIADLYRASNLFLFPSLGESFGVPIIEAQACGIPVVTTNVGPMSELVKTGDAVDSYPHPAFPAWGLPKQEKLVESLLRWIDYNKRKEVSDNIQEFAVDIIIRKYFLKILNDAKK